jgi:hypothetical protein
MDSRLASAAKRAVLNESRRLTPEARLEAFLVHSRLMMELYRAGKERRAHAPPRRT